MGRTLGFDTLKVRGGYDPRKHNYSVQVPIYETAAFSADSPERFDRIKSLRELGFLYSRIGNPTVDVLEQRVALLDHAAAAVTVGSGMAAVTFSLLNAVGGSGTILTTDQLYGGDVDAFRSLLSDYGLKVNTVSSAADASLFDEKINEDTKAVYIESISNPLAVTADIEGIAKIAHDHGIPLIVDNTVATPYLINPIDYGADVVVYSATKAISGHGSAIGGIIEESGSFNWANGRFPQFTKPNFNLRDENNKERSFVEAFPQFPFAARIRNQFVAYFGAPLSPFDAYVILLGLETLSERVSKQVANTGRIVDFLKTQENVSWISYPSIEGAQGHENAEKYLKKGAGSLLSFGLAGSEKDIYKFLNSLKLFGYQTNLGDARSLIINSPKTTHGELTQEELAKAGIKPETIRVSVGIEDAEDLIEDLKQGFAAIA